MRSSDSEQRVESRKVNRSKKPAFAGLFTVLDSSFAVHCFAELVVFLSSANRIGETIGRYDSLTLM